MRTLYICYFGLREPLVQTQVLPYLRELRKDGIEVDLLTFEPSGKQDKSTADFAALDKVLQAEGILWSALPYRKGGLATKAQQILSGARRVRQIMHDRQIEVLHARAHLPLAMALLANLFAHCKVIFDLRGLMAEEYVDAGIWKTGSLPFRVIKWLELFGLQHADHVIVLTEALKTWVIENQLTAPDRLTVIPCCVSNLHLTGSIPARASRFELVYCGSTTGIYMLCEMAAFFRELKVLLPDALFRIVTASDAGPVAATLQACGITAEDFTVQRAAPEEVPSILRHAHAGISFIWPGFGRLGASPTKIPEYLAAGLPVVCNSGVGDSEPTIKNARAGCVLQALSTEAYRAAAKELLQLTCDPGLAQRARDTATSCFSLSTVGGPRYRQVYRILDSTKR